MSVYGWCEDIVWEVKKIWDKRSGLDETLHNLTLDGEEIIILQFIL